MRSLRHFALMIFAAAASCAIENRHLIEGAPGGSSGVSGGFGGSDAGANGGGTPVQGGGGAGGSLSSDGSAGASAAGGNAGGSDVAGNVTPMEGGTAKDTGPDGPSYPPGLIDDMEDGNTLILPFEGRQGPWFIYNDLTAGTQAPLKIETLVPPRMGSTKAIHDLGQGFTGFGAIVAFDLNSPGGTKQQYNASAYTKIHFWAKSASGVPMLRFAISDRNTDPLGGVCTPTNNCNDLFGTTVTLTPAWAEFSILFKSLAQEGFGAQFPALDAAHLYSVQFQYHTSSAFDIWIDDVSLVP